MLTQMFDVVDGVWSLKKRPPWIGDEHVSDDRRTWHPRPDLPLSACCFATRGARARSSDAASRWGTPDLGAPSRAAPKSGVGAAPAEGDRSIGNRILLIAGDGLRNTSQRPARLLGRVRPSSTCRACHRSISGRSQRLGRPRPRSRTGRGVSRRRGGHVEKSCRHSRQGRWKPCVQRSASETPRSARSSHTPGLRPGEPSGCIGETSGSGQSLFSGRCRWARRRTPRRARIGRCACSPLSPRIYARGAGPLAAEPASCCAGSSRDLWIPTKPVSVKQ